MLLWALRQTEHHFVPFDVKTMSLTTRRLTVNGGRDIEPDEYTFRGNPWGSQARAGSFYVIVFEGDDEYVAVVPKGGWEQAYCWSHGIEALISGVPAWLQPFIVHRDHLRQACINMVRAAEEDGPWYVNPTTHLRCVGFRPAKTVAPPLLPEDTDRRNTSWDAVIRLWREAERHGDATRMNPIAPFFFDFYLDLKGEELISVEHKATTSHDWSRAFKLAVGRRSPFAKQRMWQVLWCDTPDDAIICFTRDEVKDEWAGATLISKEMRRNNTFPDYKSAIEHVRRHLPRARRAAEDAMAEIPVDNIDADVLFNTNARLDKILSDTSIDSSSVSPRYHPSVPWLCAQFNQACRENKFGVCLPLDVHHPLTNHMFVSHEWSEAEVTAYDQSGGTLPVNAHSPELYEENRECVFLRFQDHASPVATRTFPLRMMGTYWTQPVKDAHFLIVGNVLEKDLLEPGDPQSSKYLLLPSGFTTMFDSGTFLQPIPMADRREGRHVNQKMVIADRALPGLHRRERSFSSSSLFVKDGVDPLRYIFPLQDAARTLYRHVCKIFESEAPVSFDNPQSALPNKSFDPRPYRHRVRQVPQGVWDYGCECIASAPSTIRDSLTGGVDITQKNR